MLGEEKKKGRDIIKSEYGNIEIFRKERKE